MPENGSAVAQSKQQIEEFVTRWLSEQLGQNVSPEGNFGALGMDSLDAVELTDALADLLQVEQVDVSLVLDHPTPARLAEHLSQIG